MFLINNTMEIESILETLQAKYVGKEVNVYPANGQQLLVVVENVIFDYDDINYSLKYIYKERTCYFTLSDF